MLMNESIAMNLTTLPVGGCLDMYSNYGIIIKRVSEKTWRIGEVMGDWLLTGNLDEIDARLWKARTEHHRSDKVIHSDICNCGKCPN